MAMALFARCDFAFCSVYGHVKLYSTISMKSRAMTRDYLGRHKTSRPVPRDDSKRVEGCDETVDMFFEAHLDNIAQQKCFVQRKGFMQSIACRTERGSKMRNVF